MYEDDYEIDDYEMDDYRTAEACAIFHFNYPFAYVKDMDFLKELKSIREKVNWEVEEKRYKFLDQLYPLINCWRGQLPNLLDIFRGEEIEWIIIVGDSHYLNHPVYYGISFIEFLIKTGYKDKPEMGEDGKPSSRRTTPVHHAARSEDYSFMIPDLFKIYDRFEVNYTDELGLTHFHVACAYGIDDVVQKFLELGQDPNFPDTSNNRSPLHLALDYDRKETIRLLLQSGADPNSASSQGLMALHVICERLKDDNLAEMLFKICEDKNQTLLVDARDNLGRTSLQLAVASLFPSKVSVLLDHGADLSSFIFPTESYFDACIQSYDIMRSESKLKKASTAFKIFESLEKGGYELDRSDAVTIMNVFARLRLFEYSADLVKSLRSREDFASKAKSIMIIDPDLSLHHLIQLRPEEAEKVVTYNTDFSKFLRSKRWLQLSYRSREVGDAHMCEIITRIFCRRWAEDSFYSLKRGQLPRLCCKKIIEPLKNEDLWHICLAATSQSS